MTLSILYERLNCWLHNDPYPRPEFYACDDVFDSLFDGPPDPWQTRIFYFFRHRIKWALEWPGDKYRAVLWFIQRGRRGWSDRDAWSVDWTLTRILPPMLTRIRDNKQGMPMEFFPTGKSYYLKRNGGYDPNARGWKVAERRRNKVFNDILAGLEAGRRATELDYEVELGPFPRRREPGVSKEETRAKRDEYMKKQRKLMERDEKIRQKGLALVVKYWYCLSD